MKLTTLSKKEFKEFADNHPQITFHQTKQWANLKEKNNWKSYYLGLKKENQILGATLILAKQVPIIKKKIFYAPRGFLIDYHNKEILKEFTIQIKNFAKKEKAIFIKIDPYVEYMEHDNNGKIIKNGLNNENCIKNLKDLGYKHFGFNLMQDTLQPRWMHVIETENKSLEEIMEEMEKKTRQILRKNERSCITTREIKKEELPIFKDIMKHTSDRREFIDRPLSYYENMWDSLHESGIMKIIIAEINFKDYQKETEKELTQIKNELNDRIYKNEHQILKMNQKKYEQNNKRDQEEIKRLENQLKEIKEKEKKYGEKTILGGILFLIYGNEVLSLLGGSLEELMQFQSAYTLHFQGIKYAIENGYKKYNFYGITGDFRKEKRSSTNE